MYDQENQGSSSDKDESYSANSPESVSGGDLSQSPAKVPADAVMIQCPYCRKEFDRATTKSMPFCSSRCKQIDLGLWLNEVHGMPYEIDPGVS